MRAAQSAGRTARTTTVPARLFTLDRSTPFDPVKFIGRDWRIIEEDERALSRREIDFTKVRFKSGLKLGESIIDGEEKLRRFKALPDIRLDAKIGQALYQENDQTTLRWLHDTYGITWFELAGTVLRTPVGPRYFLVLYRFSNGSWCWFYDLLCAGRARVNVSPLLAS